MSDLSREEWGAAGWSRPSPLALSAVADEYLRHAIMLQRCFDGREMHWSDALVARTRRQIGGCLASVEMAMRLEIDKSKPSAFGLSDALPDFSCWRKVERDPTLLDASLLAHFRNRAAIGLMQQDALLAQETGDDPAAASLFPPHIISLLSAVRLAQAMWADAGPDHLPVRADLVAEAMPELVWTVGAIVADALVRVDLLPVAECLALIEQAGLTVLAQHDEQIMPVAQAELFAHQLRALDDVEERLVYLARNGHVLPLLAIAADRNAIDIGTVIRTAVEGPEQMLFSMARAAEFPREVVVRLVLGRRSVARGVDDSMLVDYADDYEQVSLEQAGGLVAPLRISRPLSVKFSMVHGRAGRHG